MKNILRGGALFEEEAEDEEKEGIYTSRPLITLDDIRSSELKVFKELDNAELAMDILRRGKDSTKICTEGEGPKFQSSNIFSLDSCPQPSVEALELVNSAEEFKIDSVFGRSSNPSINSQSGASNLSRSSSDSSLDLRNAQEV